MQTPTEIAQTAAEIRLRLAHLPAATTPAIRELRREFSRRLASAPAEAVLALALDLKQPRSPGIRFFVYELVSKHRAAFASLSVRDLIQLGHGIDNWASVDCFAMYLTGPIWAKDRIPDAIIAEWANSPDLWQRRTALVSTVPLSRRGYPADRDRVIAICAQLAPDQEDMVVKALSWALRELTKKHPAPVQQFLAEHRAALAARIHREVNNKLRTGLKSGKLRATP